MAAQPDISSILAALAAQRPANTPSQPAPQQTYAQPPPSLPQGYPGVQPTPTPPVALSGYALPQPTSSGSLDLSAIKPTNSGSVSIAEAIAKARGIAAEKGVSYDGRSSAAPAREDPRLAGRAYRRSRSRSRSPPRRDNFRDNYNPYRDERRDDARRGNAYGRERSRSPGPRGRAGFSPQPHRNYTRDRSPDGDNQETIFIDSALVGLVIGRQGENLRRVEQDTGTRIQFITGPDTSGPQRQCKITGNPRARMDAKREIYRIIDENGGNPPKEAAPASTRGSGSGSGGGSGGGRGAQNKNNQPALREGENSVQIMVPDRTVGLIIGRGGETIRDLQERSGCHVNIVGENKSINGLRPVNLIGSAQSAARAKELILEIVDSDTRNLSQQGPPQRDPGRSVGHDAYGGGGSDKQNDTIHVPSEAVGMIIGKGGETIKEMQNMTGCKINVSQASGADIEREIGLVGSRQAIEDAKRAIWDKVDQVREKNGGMRSNRGGRDNDPYSDRYSQPQQPYAQQQGYGQNMPPQQQQAGSAPVGGDGAAADPYAAWGGYQNYLTMWYAAMAQQQQAQQGQAPGGQQPPPGA